MTALDVITDGKRVYGRYNPTDIYSRWRYWELHVAVAEVCGVQARDSVIASVPCHRAFSALRNKYATLMSPQVLEAAIDASMPKLAADELARLLAPPLPYTRLLRYGRFSCTQKEEFLLINWVQERGWVYSPQYNEWAIPGDLECDKPDYMWTWREAARIQATNDALCLIRACGWHSWCGGYTARACGSDSRDARACGWHSWRGGYRGEWWLDVYRIRHAYKPGTKSLKAVLKLVCTELQKGGPENVCY